MSTSAPDKSMVDGSTSSGGICSVTFTSSTFSSLIRISYTVLSKPTLCAPIPWVAFPCGSKSTKSTLLPIYDKPDARFMDVVVFPTPPFWFAIAMIFPIILLPYEFFGKRMIMHTSSGLSSVSTFA